MIYNYAVAKKYEKPWNELTGWQKLELQGKVKQMMQTTYSAHSKDGGVAQGKIDMDKEGAVPNYVVSFNEKGVVLCEETFSEYGSSKDRYADDGRHLLSERFDIDGRRKEKKEYKYEGLVFKELITKNEEGKQTWRYTNKYNEQGKVIETLSFRNYPEELYRRRVHTYDEKGNMLTNTEYDETGDLVHQSEMRYNDKGLRVYQSTKWTSPEMLKSNKRQELQYNDHGDCIQVDDYDLEGNHKETRHYQHEYNENGKRINKNVEEDEKIAGYDEDLVNDNQGNWTKKTTYHNRIPVSIVVRELIYFDDIEQKELNHPLKNPELRKAQVKETENLYADMKEEDAKWLAEGFAQPEAFPNIRYYVSQFNQPPSTIRYYDPYVDAFAFLKQLKNYLNACEVHSHATAPHNGYGQVVNCTLAFPDAEGYLLWLHNISGHSKELFDIPDWMDDQSSSYVYFGNCVLFRPAEASGERKDYFESQLEHHLLKCSLKKKEEKPRIHIIEMKNNEFVLTEYPVHDDFIIKDLDVNYGYGFERFHNELMKKFASGTKGLVLFNGEPGTGKTYYIRHLLRKMMASKKSVIYMPPNMVDHLAEPVFMTFLTEEIRDFSIAGQNCVLLVEDAEPLLMNRENVTRNQGITNLLNMTDGILNDLLNLQIICTFNTKLEELDPALLRPGRLIAKKEFKALSVIDANRLGKRLGIRHTFKLPATLGQIYSMREDASTITHEVMDDEAGSTTVDDWTR
jgi:hypothetical protein